MATLRSKQYLIRESKCSRTPAWKENRKEFACKGKIRKADTKGSVSVELNTNPYFGKEGKEKAAKMPATAGSKPALIQENKNVRKALQGTKM
jgi:hypothetical protein